MTKRTYGQHCAIARALDRIGDRWTLLLVRELLIGPKRFKDLEAALPGIGANLLSARLKELKSTGIVRRIVLPPPASVPAYALTSVGLELEPVLLALVRWGERFLEAGSADDYVRAEWAVLVLRGIFRPEAAKGLSAVYEFRMGEEVVHVEIDDGQLSTGLGPARHPDVVLTGDLEHFLASAAGTLDMAQALADGKVTLEGDPALLQHLGDVFPPRSERMK
jgi:DNA-binding HxlR family transcriptional regulator